MFDIVERSNSLKERVKTQKYFKLNKTLKNIPHLSGDLSPLPIPIKSESEKKYKSWENYIFICPFWDHATMDFYREEFRKNVLKLWQIECSDSMQINYLTHGICRCSSKNPASDISMTLESTTYN